MEKIRLTKISGDKLIPIISSTGNRSEKYIDGYANKNIYTEIPTVGCPFGISNYQEEENYANIHPYGLKFDEQFRMHLTVLPKERAQLIFTKGENKIPTLPK